MRALALVAARQPVIAKMSTPPAPGAGEVQTRVEALVLNQPFDGVARALKRMESRQVFGEIVVGF